jgi:hypothetical protein
MNGLKFANAEETEIIGLLAPNGGPFRGKDIQGENFLPETDFVLGWYDSRPLLYQHGLDPVTGVSTVGRIKSVWKDVDGLWMQSQLDAASEYNAVVKELIKREVLGLSSSAPPHLVRRNKSGEILRWPLLEGSLTPTPANPMAMLKYDYQVVKSHFKAIGVEPLEELALETDILTEYNDALIEGSLENHASFVKSTAESLLVRTKDLQERRVKAGRVISTLNRTRLTECLAAMRTATDDLAQLLDSTNPAPAAEAKAHDVRRLRASLEASYLRSLLN